MPKRSLRSTTTKGIATLVHCLTPHEEVSPLSDTVLVGGEVRGGVDGEGQDGLAADGDVAKG